MIEMLLRSRSSRYTDAWESSFVLHDTLPKSVYVQEGRFEGVSNHVITDIQGPNPFKDKLNMAVGHNGPLESLKAKELNYKWRIPTSSTELLSLHE